MQRREGAGEPGAATWQSQATRRKPTTPHLSYLRRLPADCQPAAVQISLPPRAAARATLALPRTRWRNVPATEKGMHHTPPHRATARRCCAHYRAQKTGRRLPGRLLRAFKPPTAAGRRATAIPENAPLPILRHLRTLHLFAWRTTPRTNIPRAGGDKRPAPRLKTPRWCCWTSAFCALVQHTHYLRYSGRRFPSLSTACPCA